MSIYNEDEIVPPSWINHDFFENVLRQYENNQDIEIANVDITPASLKGDHYASVMFRCKVSYNCSTFPNIKQKSIILKTLPTEGPKRDMLRESKLFETEISIYTEVLPKIEKILAKCGEPTKLSAEIIYSHLEPHKVLILEDLCEAGYETIRGRYLTENEVKMIYDKIAKLHAVSFLLSHTEERESVIKFQDGLFCVPAIMDMGLMSEGIENFMDMLSKDKQLRPYLEKVETMKPIMMEKCKNLYQAYKLNRESSDIFVLNHGDFHMRNMMFKFNSENHLQDVIMIDYQISCFAPSTIDLAYSQYLILSPELRLRRNEFMHYYFEKFICLLKKTKFQGKLPKYSDLQIAGLKYRHFSLFLLSTFLPHVRMILVPSADKLKDLDTAKYVECPDMAVVAYQQPEFIDEMRQFLPRLLMDGYLD